METHILRKAGQHGLPLGRTHRFADLTADLQERIIEAVGARAQGRPVLAFVDSPPRWTLLTTREVTCQDKGQLLVVGIRDLASVSNDSQPPQGASPEEIGRWKGSWEYLGVVNRSGGRGALWVPCGGEAYALWNILLPYTRADR